MPQSSKMDLYETPFKPEGSDDEARAKAEAVFFSIPESERQVSQGMDAVVYPDLDGTPYLIVLREEYADQVPGIGRMFKYPID